MKLIKDLGVVFIKPHHKTKRRAGIYECPGCSKHYTVQTQNVLSGKSTMCRKCSASICNTTHGLKDHPLYTTWTNMKSRCYNKNNSHYNVYGGEGVTVCPEWISDFKSFYEWAIQTWAPGSRLDKDILCMANGISPKIYSPHTCQFVTNTKNVQATRVLKSTNTSGFRGVSMKKGSGNWVAQINIDTKKKHIGTFKTKQQAAVAYDAYIVSHNLTHTRNFTWQEQVNNKQSLMLL